MRLLSIGCEVILRELCAYERFVLPDEAWLVDAIRATGAWVRLHICGNTQKIAHGMGAVGAELVDLDFLTPMVGGRAAMGSDQVLLGNLATRCGCSGTGPRRGLDRSTGDVVGVETALNPQARLGAGLNPSRPGYPLKSGPLASRECGVEPWAACRAGGPRPIGH